MSERDLMYSRRVVVTGAGVAAGAVLLGQNAWAQEARKEERRLTAEEAEVSAPEELMRQHAIVDRLLLIYDNAITPEAGSTRPSLKSLVSTTALLRTNVNEHIRLEDEHVFPAFQKADKMTDLVSTLREQHTAAKRLADLILRETEKGEGANRELLDRHLRAYVRMMQAHTAYEETSLYPQIHTVVSPEGFRDMRIAIRDAARKTLGPEGFPGLVAQVADLERAAGITSLAQFTARVSGEQTAMGAPPR